MSDRSRALVTPKMATRLVQLCGMFGSNFDGEVANAARAAHELVTRMGLSWSDLIVQPPAEWQHMAKVCRDHRFHLNDVEKDFIANIAKLRRQPSDKQLAWLTSIFERLERERAA